MGQDVLKRLEISFTGPDGDIQDIFFWWENAYELIVVSTNRRLFLFGQLFGGFIQSIIGKF